MTLPKALQQSLRCPLLSAVSECVVSPAMHRCAAQDALPFQTPQKPRSHLLIGQHLNIVVCHPSSCSAISLTRKWVRAGGTSESLSLMNRRRAQRPVWAERGDDHSETFYTIKLVNGQEKVVRKSLSQARTSKK